MSRVRSWFLFPCMALAALLVTGCGGTPSTDYGSIEILSVSGTVKLDGKPVDKAVVVFQDEKDKTMSYGLTNSSGSFSLEFDSEKSGCTPGRKVVQISTKRKILGLNASESDAEADPDAEAEGAAPAEELIPSCYNKESKLSAEVSSSKTSFEFDLKADCSTTGAI